MVYMLKQNLLQTADRGAKPNSQLKRFYQRMFLHPALHPPPFVASAVFFELSYIQDGRDIAHCGFHECNLVGEVLDSRQRKSMFQDPRTVEVVNGQPESLVRGY